MYNQRFTCLYVKECNLLFSVVRILFFSYGFPVYLSIDHPPEFSTSAHIPGDVFVLYYLRMPFPPSHQLAPPTSYVLILLCFLIILCWCFVMRKPVQLNLYQCRDQRPPCVSCSNLPEFKCEPRKDKLYSRFEGLLAWLSGMSRKLSLVLMPEFCIQEIIMTWLF